MNNIQDFFVGLRWDIFIKTGLRVTLILVFSWIAMKLLQNFLKRFENHLIKKSEEEGEPPSESEKRIETIGRSAYYDTIS